VSKVHTTALHGSFAPQQAEHPTLWGVILEHGNEILKIRLLFDLLNHPRLGWPTAAV